MSSTVDLLSRLIVIFTAIRCVKTSEGNFETYTYYTIVSRQQCVQRGNNVCSSVLWGLWSNCRTEYWNDCSIVYAPMIQQGQKCKTGWTSNQCDVPVCSSGCTGGKVCTAPETCTCVTTGDSCISVPCGDNLNCYPGSCVSGSCSCPAGFSGPNCLTILKTPEITSCYAQLHGSFVNGTVQANCAAYGVEPTTVWISPASLAKVEVYWVPEYRSPFSLPDRTFAPYVQNSPVPLGVTDAGYNIAASPGSATGVYASCAISPSPATTFICDVIKDWSYFGITPAHNQTLRINVTAKIGGHKDGANQPNIPGSNFPPTNFIGTDMVRSVQLKFDTIAPVHCLSNPNNMCSLFAIFLDQDITNASIIQPKFYNWSDDGSGISKFHVEVYYMQPDTNNLLINLASPEKQSDVDPSQNNFAFAPTRSGVYSIELTVQDQAGNSAKARKLFIYNKDSRLTTDPNNPVFIKEADPNTAYQYLTAFDDPRNGGNIPLTLTWTGHFSSSSKFDGNWGFAAKPWDSGIDDSYGYTYGRRSTAALMNMPGGITSYSVAFIVDKDGGGRGLVANNANLFYLNATANFYALPIPSLSDGNTIVVWLQCMDVAGGVATEKLVVYVDRSLAEFKDDPKFNDNGIDDSTSSVSISVFDKSSGIQQISFGIYDTTVGNLVRSGSTGPQKRDSPTNQGRRKKRLVSPCTANDTTCYCTPSGDCYNYIQIVRIDNCWLDRLSGHKFEFRFTVTNGANKTTSEQTVTLGVLNLQCRGGLNTAGIVVGCIIGVLVLIALVIIIVILVRVYVFKKPVPRRLTSARNAVRSKIFKPQLTENIVYAASNSCSPPKRQCNLEREETYVYSTNPDNFSNKQHDNNFKISRNQLHFDEIISEGRFAVIKGATLTRGNESTVVATKGLTRGFSDSDVTMMEEKIAFLREILTHDNLVKFIGTVNETDNTGPIMVMELCDLPLRDWLSQKKIVESEDLNNMTSFTHDIAKGVKHLHDNKIVHRRLGVRNVLLKHEYGGLIAKVIGHGPNKEDTDGQKASLPIKWLAPETLETIHTVSPTYNNKTDAWSYGITIWEIYSKGEPPYSNMKTDQVKKGLIKKDKHMLLTRPELCPPELFDAAVSPCWNFFANKRPEFSEICSNVKMFRDGNGSEQPGYYTSNPNEYDRTTADNVYQDAA